MDDTPLVIDMLYHQWVLPPDPEKLSEDDSPDRFARAYGKYAFYQGLRLAIRLFTACEEQ